MLIRVIVPSESHTGVVLFYYQKSWKKDNVHLSADIRIYVYLIFWPAFQPVWKSVNFISNLCFRYSHTEARIFDHTKMLEQSSRQHYKTQILSDFSSVAEHDHC